MAQTTSLTSTSPSSSTAPPVNLTFLPSSGGITTCSVLNTPPGTSCLSWPRSRVLTCPVGWNKTTWFDSEVTGCGQGPLHSVSVIKSIRGPFTFCHSFSCTQGGQGLDVEGGLQGVDPSCFRLKGCFIWDKSEVYHTAVMINNPVRHREDIEMMM